MTRARVSFSSPIDHHLMLRDETRVLAYRQAIFAHARDRIVLDLGTGSGILAVFAAQAGARRVYAVERSRVAGLARLMMRANRCADRVQVIEGDSREVTLPEPADLIVHELFGADPFVEDLLELVADARRRLGAPGAQLLPRRVEVWCAGAVGEAAPLGERLARESHELGVRYGVSLAPYAAALEAVAPALSASVLPVEDDEPRLLSEPCRLFAIDLAEGAIPEPVSTTLRIHAAGRLAATALWFEAELDDETRLSTSPLLPRTHWGRLVRELGRAREVRPGDQVPIRARLEDIEGLRVLVEIA
jgi:SAM-dependent methyltransferase